ncbi:MAG: hypothetical protein CM1200mP33_4440 [Chloroflexota bacterium]|nr:MAG: hypothetical protein CM1200mP33_4440 [Chloroflexota bacterium]
MKIMLIVLVKFVIGTVHQIQRDNIFVNIEYAELRMPRKELIQSKRVQKR